MNKSSRPLTCWIIGASHGIGKALAYKYHKEGYNVIISARSKNDLKLIKSDLCQESNQVVDIAFDINDFTLFSKSCNSIIKKFKKIDLAIFCSAIYEQMDVFDFDIELAHKIFNTNFGGCLNFIKIITTQMQRQQFGHIAMIASVAGYFGLPNSLAYGASKAAMINLTEGIYSQLKRKNIDLSLINPGFVDTRLTKKNKFSMPCIISQKEAADLIFSGLKKKRFEIHFPLKFTLFLKLIKLLPYRALFYLTNKLL
jgi:short-subunit dehydrogenase